MIHTCERCKKEFLTEADYQIIKPTQEGWRIYCFCEVINLEKEIQELKQREERLKAGLEFYAIATDIPDNKNESLNYARIQGNGCSQLSDGYHFHGGKLARQTLKELYGEEK